jgi:hypothetical protein
MKLVWRLTTIDKAFFIIFGVAIIASFLTWVFEERFDEEAWRSYPSRRYKMADDIVDEEIFIGMSRPEIMDILGEPVDPLYDDQSLLNYRIGSPPSFSKVVREELIITFVNKKAVNVFRVRMDE